MNKHIIALLLMCSTHASAATPAGIQYQERKNLIHRLFGKNKLITLIGKNDN